MQQVSWVSPLGFSSYVSNPPTFGSCFTRSAGGGPFLFLQSSEHGSEYWHDFSRMHCAEEKQVNGTTFEKWRAFRCLWYGPLWRRKVPPTAISTSSIAAAPKAQASATPQLASAAASIPQQFLIGSGHSQPPASVHGSEEVRPPSVRSSPLPPVAAPEVARQLVFDSALQGGRLRARPHPRLSTQCSCRAKPSIF